MVGPFQVLLMDEISTGLPVITFHSLVLSFCCCFEHCKLLSSLLQL